MEEHAERARSRVTAGLAVVGRRIEETARAGARALRNASERMLHPLRREIARRRVRGLVDGKLEVVFVCHGNICRSPYAAAAFSERLPESLRWSIDVSSAGFIGPGRSTPSAGVAAAASLGVDLSRHVSFPVSAVRPEGRLLVVAMDSAQVRALTVRFRNAAAVVIQLGDLDPEPIGRRHIRDPINQPEAVFRKTYVRIDRCVAELTRLLQDGS